jgi:protein-disulfide isomerase
MKQQIETALNWVSSVALIGAAGVLVWTFTVGPIWTPPDPNGPRVEDVSETISVSQNAALFGEGDTVIVEFTDYECPYCNQFSQTILPGLKQLENVRYVSMNYPLTSIHPNATSAAVAAICAGEQGKLDAMHAQLFSGPLARADYDAYSTAVGLDGDQFASCVTSSRALSVLEDQKTLAKRFNIQGTPMFLIGTMQADGRVAITRKVRGGMDLQAFTREVERVRAN